MLNWIYDCEVVYVMYPYMTFEDGTEVVHSDLITDGDIEKVIVHFERPTVEASTPLAVGCLPVRGLTGKGILLRVKNELSRSV